MRKILQPLLIILFFLGMSLDAIAQCTPADSTTCPDPENNGQICPDSLKNGYLNQEYNQTISILAPPQIVVQGIPIPIKYIHLVDVGNLPPGISWKSDDSTNNFYPHIYSCVLLSGVSADTGTYTLRIKVDVYGDIAGTPVLLGQNVDSTSLSITVEASNGIDKNIFIRQKIKVWPNPFEKEFHLQFLSPSGNSTQIEIYTLLGKRVFRQNYPTSPGQNTLTIDGNVFHQQHYIIKLTTGGKQYTAILTKAP
ncbi:MAG: hypothetical protein IEMM0006_1667 [bacterium]|nr:MAG: hypothetical protein IEMM0006_1667 [bacterium]